MNNRRTARELKRDKKKVFEKVLEFKTEPFTAIDITRKIKLADDRRDWVSGGFNNLVSWGVFTKTPKTWKWKWGAKKDINQTKFLYRFSRWNPNYVETEDNAQAKLKKDVPKNDGLVTDGTLKLSSTPVQESRSDVLRRLREQAAESERTEHVRMIIRTMSDADKWQVFKYLNKELSGKE